uniref:Uncharacterized protein n=1 Tax=Arundo donax TaxID=35708 RepID=A0A0A8YHC8_ARUDO
MPRTARTSQLYRALTFRCSTHAVHASSWSSTIVGRTGWVQLACFPCVGWCRPFLVTAMRQSSWSWTVPSWQVWWIAGC